MRRQTFADVRGVAADIRLIMSDARGPLRDFARAGLPELLLLISDARQMIGTVDRAAQRFESSPSSILFGDKASEYKSREDDDGARSASFAVAARAWRCACGVQLGSGRRAAARSLRAVAEEHVRRGLAAGRLAARRRGAVDGQGHRHRSHRDRADGARGQVLRELALGGPGAAHGASS